MKLVVLMNFSTITSVESSQLKELRLGILGALRLWWPFIEITKLVELRFAEFCIIGCFI